jgi:6,7-dimethyl-8-ribityllumazine synthase
MKLDLDTARQPSLSAAGLKVAIVSARFNDRLVQMMREGAEAAWVRHGGDMAQLGCYEVPGAYE